MKKITVVPPVVSAIAPSIHDAIAIDVANCLACNASAKEVSSQFDKNLSFNWTAYKGNSSALKCSLSDTNFKCVADIRDSYKTAWSKAGLLNFDRRWQYACQLSKHFITPPTDAAAKSKAAPKAVAAASAEVTANPVKKAIEQVSSIPRLVLGLKPSQCAESLRKQIATLCGDLTELLNQIK